MDCYQVVKSMPLGPKMAPPCDLVLRTYATNYLTMKFAQNFAYSLFYAWTVNLLNNLLIKKDMSPCSIFSSPESKAQGELIVLDSSGRASVHTFKHEYL